MIAREHELCGVRQHAVRPRRVRLLLVDDDRPFLQALTALLADDPAMTVVGTAPNGRRALELAAELDPDVITMDIDMPEMDGVEATRIIAERHPHICVVTITASTYGERIEEAREAGAFAHVMKFTAAEDLAATIHGAWTNRLKTRAWVLPSS